MLRGLMLVAIVGTNWPFASQSANTFAQETSSAEATIATQQTRVADLEAALGVKPTPESIPASNTADTAQLSIAGTATDLIPAGEEGFASVVAVGDYEPADGLPVVVRNDATRTLYDLLVTAAVYDETGRLIASGDNRLSFAPYIIKPGEITIGTMDFQGIDLPETATFDFTLQARTITDNTDLNDVTIVPFEAIDLSQIDDRLVGQATNTTNRAISTANSRVMYIGKDGRPLHITQFPSTLTPLAKLRRLTSNCH
jgi:hypothetical protein